MKEKKKLTIKEIQRKVEPIALKYGFPAVYLFGSYARGDATADSDIDIVVDVEGIEKRSMFQIGAIFNDFEDVFGEGNVDMVTLDSLSNAGPSNYSIRFAEHVNKERKVIYEKARA